jgi:hypothetical protein
VTRQCPTVELDGTQRLGNEPSDFTRGYNPVDRIDPRLATGRLYRMSML